MKRYPQYPRVHVATLGSRIRKQLSQGRGMGRERRYSSGMIAGYRLLPAMSCIARTCLSTASASLSRFYTIISTNLRCFHLSLSTLHPPVNTPVLPAAHLHNPYRLPDLGPRKPRHPPPQDSTHCQTLGPVFRAPLT
jgi:hypothetical protein